MGLVLQRLEEVKDESQRSRFLAAARRGHADMARLVNNLLSAARLDAGSQRYRFDTIAVSNKKVKVRKKLWIRNKLFPCRQTGGISF